MKRTPLVFSLACAFGLAMLPSVRAGMFSLNPDAADGRIQTGSGNPPAIDDQNDYASRIGEFNAPGASCYVIPFQLPALTGGENGFTAASLRFQLFTNTMSAGQGNADLYALGVRATSALSTADYYNGSAQDTAPGHTLIQASLLTPTTPLRINGDTGFVTTSASANTALVDYLNSVDPGGVNAGQFVFFRVNYALDSPIPNGNIYYELLTREAGGDNEKPLLSLTSGVVAAPEPSAFVLMGLGGSALVMLRRRRK